MNSLFLQVALLGSLVVLGPSPRGVGGPGAPGGPAGLPSAPRAAPRADGGGAADAQTGRPALERLLLHAWRDAGDSADLALDGPRGWTVAVAAPFAAIGVADEAPALSEGGVARTGAVHLFEREGDGWVFAERLTPDAGTHGDRFGAAVALDEGRLAVGAPQDDGPGVDTDPSDDRGAVFVYRHGSGGWELEAELAAHDGGAGDRFGSALDLQGDTLLVGAAMDDDHSGSAYVFQRKDGGWTQVARLVPDDRGFLDELGCAVALSGDVAVVGAHHHDEETTNKDRGAAYVYRRSDDGWKLVQKLVASDGAKFDEFGNAVAVDGDTILVGAWLDDDRGISSGSVYVFRDRGGRWVEDRKIVPEDGAAYDYFGVSLALAGDRAVIGSYQDDLQGLDAGSVQVFERVGDAWERAAVLLAPDGGANDAFGADVALEGTTVVVGALRQAWIGDAAFGQRFEQ